MSGVEWLFILVVAAILAAIVFLAMRRRREIEAWANGAGLSFCAGSDRSFDRRYPEFRCLRVGHHRAAYNIVTGLWNGRRLEAFDYRYVTGHGKDRSTHTFSAVILESHVPLQPLSIRPENALDRITAFFGVEDINFESAQFSKEFYVKSADKKWAYDVLHQRAMEFLLSKPRFSMEFSSRHVICWRHRRFGVDARVDAIDTAEGLLDLLPEYVVRQQKGEA